MGYDFPVAKSEFSPSSAALRSKRTLQPPSVEPIPLMQRGATGPRRPYRTIGMLRNAGLNKDLHGAMNGMPVPYMTKAERQPYEVTVGNDGRLYQRESGEQAHIRMDTSSAINPRGAYLFAMDDNGNIFAAASTAVRHHSAFFAGRPGAAFGTIAVSDGRLERVSDWSGHYAPPRDYSLQFVTELKRRNCDFSSMQARFHGHKKSDIKKANARLGIEFERLYLDGPKKKKY